MDDYKNYDKVNDFLMECIKHEQAKSIRSGDFLDHGLDAVVALYDAEQDFRKIGEDFEQFLEKDSERDEHDFLMEEYKYGGRPSGYTSDSFKKLSKAEVVKLSELQFSMIYVMASWGWYSKEDKEQRLQELSKEIGELLDEA